MFTIRHAGQDDLPVLKRLVAELHEQARRYDASLPAADAIIDAYFDYLVSRSRDSGGRFLLAVDRNDGTASAMRVSSVACRPTSRTRARTVTRSSPTSASCRLAGAWASGVSEAERLGRSSGAPKIELNVLARNDAAAGFYRGLGYEPRTVRLTKKLDGVV